MKLNFKNTSSETDLKIKLVKKTGTIDTTANENPTLGTTGNVTTFCLAKKAAGGAATAVGDFIWAFNLNDPTVNEATTQQTIIIDGVEYQLFGFVQGSYDTTALKLDVTQAIMPPDTPPDNLPAGFTPYIKLTITNADPDNDREMSIINTAATAAFIWNIPNSNPSFVENVEGKEFVGTLLANTVALNELPVVEELPQIELFEGETYNGQILASDANNDTLAYTLASYPDNADVTVNRNTGEFEVRVNDYIYLNNTDLSADFTSFDVNVSDGKGYVLTTIYLVLKQKPLTVDFPDNYQISVAGAVPNQTYSAGTTYKGWTVGLGNINIDSDGNGVNSRYWYYPDLIGAPNLFTVRVSYNRRKTTEVLFASKGIKYSNNQPATSYIHPYLNIKGASGTKVSVRYWDNVVRKYTLGEDTLVIDPSEFNIEDVTINDSTEEVNFKPFVHLISDGDIVVDTNADIINVEEQDQTKIITTFQPNKGHVRSQFYGNSTSYPNSSLFRDLGNGNGWEFTNARNYGTKPESAIYQTGLMLPYVDEGYVFISGERGGMINLNSSYSTLDHDKDFTIEFFINVLDKSDPLEGNTTNDKITTHILNNGILKLMALKDNINQWTLEGNGTTNNTLDVDVALTAGEWHHVALINDGATMTTHFMFDGVKVGQVSVGSVGSSLTTMGLAHDGQFNSVDIKASQLNFGLNSYRSVKGFKMYPTTGFTKPSKKLPLPEKIEAVHKA